MTKWLLNIPCKGTSSLTICLLSVLLQHHKTLEWVKNPKKRVLEIEELCVWVCVWACVCLCVCVCMWDRENGRERCFIKSFVFHPVPCFKAIQSYKEEGKADGKEENIKDWVTVVFSVLIDSLHLLPSVTTPICWQWKKMHRLLDRKSLRERKRIENGRENFRELRDRHFTAENQIQVLTKTCTVAL